MMIGARPGYDVSARHFTGYFLVRTVGLSRRITPHMFRHTAATLLIEGEVDIRFAQRLLGHSSITTTEIYTHISDLALRTALERADVMQKLCSPDRIGANRSAGLVSADASGPPAAADPW